MTATELLTKAIEEISAGALDADRVAEMIDARLDGFKPGSIDEDRVRSIFSEALSKAVDAIPPKTITVNVGEIVTSFAGQHVHPQFDRILTAIAAGLHVCMIGPAGSGKSTIARQIAKALDRSFYESGPLHSKYDCPGFVDAHGNPVRTTLWDAYEHGAVYHQDEMDASNANAILSGLNLPLANGQCSFAGQTVPRHPDFVCIASANTWGTGASREYVGRNQIDAATLDRFITIPVDYDEALERAIAQSDKWVDFVQSARKAVFDLKIRAVISPRASIQGATLIRAGMPAREVAAYTVWRGMDETTIAKIKDHIKSA